MEDYWKMRKVIGWIFHLVSRFEVEGVENIPEEGGCLLVLNHISRLDTPALLVASPRRIYPLVADKYQTYPLFKWLLTIAEAVWISRSEFDRQALLASVDVLRRGDVLGIAPEGTRSPDGSLQKAKSGVAFLAARTGASILPVGITGTRSMLQSFVKLRRMHVHLKFGESFRLPKYGKLSADELAEATDLIMARVAAQLPPAYRGAYASFALESQALT
jgi:1-acyl-sn-glycerol-3-phosphate acyltransferase